MNKLFLIIILILILIFREKLYFTNAESVDVVVARYNEPLDWLNDDPFNKYNVIVYNKSNNENFYKSDKIKEVINLPNVGREMHTYLYHIINNYDNLAETTVFLPGSSQLTHKMMKANKLFSNIDKKTVIICSDKTGDVKKAIGDFKLDNYMSTDKNNATLNGNSEMLPSTTRPFGEWYSKFFGDSVTTCLNYHLIFSMSKKDIIKKPKSYYEKLIKELDSNPNHETGHYIERSTEAVFGPIDPDSLIFI